MFELNGLEKEKAEKISETVMNIETEMAVCR